MKKHLSHYDNLKVARDAPVEVIRAAYRSLAQKYHPDRNANSADAEQAMQVINEAYAVLSDPLKRRDHDEWLARGEAGGTAPRQAGRTGRADGGRPAPHGRHRAGATAADEGSRRGYLRWLIGISAMALAILFWPGGEAPKSKNVPVGTGSAAARPAARPSVPTQLAEPSGALPVPVAGHVRPAAAPNGRSWPRYADYVGGYPRLQEDGLSTVTLDNSLGDTDVFVKLVALNELKAYSCRWAFIPARGSLVMENVTAGNYDIRYRDLDTGRFWRTEPFKLEEVQAESGMQVSKITLSVARPRDGGVRAHGLAEADF